MVRVIQKIMQDQKLVPTPVVVMNKPGGNQTLGTVYVRQHANDPHYLLYSTSQVFGAEITGLSTDALHRADADLAPDHRIQRHLGQAPIRRSATCAISSRR